MAKFPDKPKSYVIKVPVYTSEPIEKPNDLFGGISYNHMIKYAINMIECYKAQSNKISRKKRNKVQTKEIDDIVYFENKIGDVPVLLLKVSAYNTNLHDGYVEIDRKITLQQNNKLGSDNNFMLLYPHITGIDSNNYLFQWFILIYEDPNKDNPDLINTAKLVLDKILKIPVANIKLPQLIKELQKIGTIPELALKFSSISFDENDVDVKYRSYLTNSRLRKVKEENFKDMPLANTEELLDDFSYEDEFQKREIRIGLGKKEYRITREQKNDVNESTKQFVEAIFNSTMGITEQEMDDIYKPEFVLEKLTSVLSDYLA